MAPSMTELKRNTRLKKPRFTVLWTRGLVIQHLEGGERAEGYGVSTHGVTRRGWEKNRSVVPAQHPGKGDPPGTQPQESPRPW